MASSVHYINETIYHKKEKDGSQQWIIVLRRDKKKD